MSHPVYIGMRHARRRFYCWMTGSGMWALPNGDCPECGEYGAAHREMGADECGSFADCDRSCGDTDAHDGHPCALPPDHEGKHDWRGERR